MKLSYPRLSSIYVLDQDQALDFYVGVLGLEVGTDADLGFMRWLTVRAPGDDREILLERPGPRPTTRRPRNRSASSSPRVPAAAGSRSRSTTWTRSTTSWSGRVSRSPSRPPTSPTAGTWACATRSATTSGSGT